MQNWLQPPWAYLPALRQDSLPKRLAAWAMDWMQNIIYPRRLLPPFSMRRVVGQGQWELGGQQFEDHGRHFTEKLTEDAGLRPESRVLDLGSGCGRIAIPLTKILRPPGFYYGLEPVKELVGWCCREVTSRFPHFQFVHCDVRNALHNPQGRENPETYQLPFEANQFDLIIVTSIFTHLLPAATQRYIAECARVLAPAGRFFGTFFLIDNGTSSADGFLKFIHPQHDIALSIDPQLPERAVAYHSDWLLDPFRRSKMRFLPPVRWGGWTGRQPAYSGQDVLIFEKES